MAADNRPSWDEYFMKMANDVATRTTCLRRGVGAVIVKDRRIPVSYTHLDVYKRQAVDGLRVAEAIVAARLSEAEAPAFRNETASVQPVSGEIASCEEGSR